MVPWPALGLPGQHAAPRTLHPLLLLVKDMPQAHTLFVCCRPQALGFSRAGAALTRLIVERVFFAVTGGHSKKDLRYTQKPIYLPILNTSNNIWSYLLYGPV